MVWRQAAFHHLPGKVTLIFSQLPSPTASHPSEHPSKGRSKAMDPSPTSTSSPQRDFSTLGQAVFPAATISRRLPFSLAPSPSVPADPAITGCPAGRFLPPSRDPDHQQQKTIQPTLSGIHPTKALSPRAIQMHKGSSSQRTL